VDIFAGRKLLDAKNRGKTMTSDTIEKLDGVPLTTDKELTLKLQTPKDLWVSKMPPVPPKPVARLNFSAFLTNNSKSEKELTAPTPCDIENWAIFHSTGILIDSDKLHEEYCIQQFQTYPINGGETLRKDGTININARLLREGEAYFLVYVWWGVIEGWQRFT
jgi:hypothetical protein